MAYLRLADAGATNNSLPVVIQDLGYHASTYHQLLILCTNGDQIYVTNGGGGGGSEYYTTPAVFTGLQPGSVYGFRVEAIWTKGDRMVPIPNNGSLTYFETTGSVPVPAPGEPTVYMSGVTKNTVLWRITAGSNTTRIYIDRSWSTVDNTSLNSNSTWYYEYTGNPGTQYGIRVRGWNSGAGYGPWSDWRYGTTEEEIEVGSVGLVTVTNILTDRFTLTWNYATNANAYLVQYRKDGTSSWSNITTSGRSTTITGLDSATYYEYRVRGYNGDVNGVYSTLGTVRTQNIRPTALNWPTFVAGRDITLTAKNWNDMTSKINAWLVYEGKNTRTMATAYTGNNIEADMYNDIINRLEELDVPGTIPSPVSRGDDITASKINAIGNAIDSL